MEPTLLPPAHLWVSAVSLPRAWHTFCEGPLKRAMAPQATSAGDGFRGHLLVGKAAGSLLAKQKNTKSQRRGEKRGRVQVQDSAQANSGPPSSSTPISRAPKAVTLTEWSLPVNKRKQ